MKLAVGAAELMEKLVWKSKQEIDSFIKSNREENEDEIADVLYNVVLFSSKVGVDPVAAFHAKMKKNRAKYPADKVRGSHKKYTEYQ